MHFGWPKSFGVVGDIGSLETLGKTGLHRGVAIEVPADPSTGTSSAYDFNVNLNRCVGTIDETPFEVTPAADVDLASAASATPLADGESIIYTLVAWKSKGDGVIRTKWVAGAIAVDASCVRAVIADIEAGWADGTVYMFLGETKLNQSDGTTVVQTYNNTVAPVMMPDYVPSNL